MVSGPNFPLRGYIDMGFLHFCNRLRRKRVQTNENALALDAFT